MLIEKLRERKLEECLVLIVDDQASVRVELETLLENTAICHSVSSGNDALTFCDNHTPDLILMDVNMPELDGHETTALLKANPSFASIPIIFVTSSNSDDEQSKCWEAGCVDFIIKPVNACTLRHRVKSHLTHKLKNDLFEKLIYIDKLTGAYNRHYLDDYLPRLIRDGRRNTAPLSAIILDVDHFKLFNDMYGHLAGDHCLWKISKNIDDTLMRPMDKLVRLGGEEFLVLLPDTNVDGAIEVTKRLLTAIYEMNIPHAASNYNRVTVSAGVTVKQHDDAKTIDYMLLEADKNLYEAKMQGRNQMKISSANTQAKTDHCVPNL